MFRCGFNGRRIGRASQQGLSTLHLSLRTSTADRHVDQRQITTPTTIVCRRFHCCRCRSRSRCRFYRHRFDGHTATISWIFFYLHLPIFFFTHLPSPLALTLPIHLRRPLEPPHFRLRNSDYETKQQDASVRERTRVHPTAVEISDDDRPYLHGHGRVRACDQAARRLDDNRSTSYVLCRFRTGV